MLLVAALAIGLSVKLFMQKGADSIAIEYNSAAGPSEILTWTIAAVGFGLVVGGIIWEIRRQKALKLERSSRRVLVVESRGLRNFAGSALKDAVPCAITGVRESIIIDTREHVVDGVLLCPDQALRKVENAPQLLTSRENSQGRSDRTIVYGGLSPVPFTFLLGVLLDDEGAIVPMDWDRTLECWRQLDGIDDNERFAIRNLDSLSEGTTEAVLAVSVSYAVNREGILQKFPTLPIVEMALPTLSPANHWSGTKQSALAQQFLETAIQLEARGVRHLHLVLACQNSVAFRLGRIYDKRNLPLVTVYQYERAMTPPYPWGITMPVESNDSASVR